MRVKPPSLYSIAAALAGLLAMLGAGGAGTPLAAATPPPTPPPITGAPVTPQPEVTFAPPGGPSLGPTAPTPGISATPSPPPNARKGLDGVWEVEIQHPNATDYTHLQISQQGDALTGAYLDAKGKKFPLAGSVDGQSVRLIVSLPNGTTLLLEGKLDGTTDMIGILTSADGQLPFTAAYRAKEKWIENVNPSPGGVGGSGGGYTPPRR